MNLPHFLENRLMLQVKLINEEHSELIEAILERDMVKLADACADLIYVIIGLAVEFNIPLGTVWDAVHVSNMAKRDPKTGKVLKRADGKVLKPEGWQPPDIRAILYGTGKVRQ
jgi:predicted HAD superfamily Cof-like phosphohydrolase